MKKPDLLAGLPKRKEGMLNIFFYISENSGVGYYRQYLPAKYLAEKNIENAVINDFKWAEGEMIKISHDDLFDIFCWADLVVVGRRDVGEFYAEWGGCREFFNVPIILDTDDNVQHVRPSNIGYRSYNPTTEHGAWNKMAMNSVFDAVTVSTEHLRDFYKKVNPKIYVLPNNLPMDVWDKYRNKKYKDGFIRFGFIGSSSHTEGVRIIKNSALRILKKYPNTKFCITKIYSHEFNDWPEEIKKRVEFLDWFKLKDWQKGLKSIGLDIGLAPLADNMFNRSKSNLRWMEYSACGIPTIASVVKPYLCIDNKKNGILVREEEEWHSSIEKLVKDEGLRHNIGKEALKTIRNEYDINKNAEMWSRVYREVHNKFRKFFGEKKKFIKISRGKYKQLN